MIEGYNNKQMTRANSRVKNANKKSKKRTQTLEEMLAPTLKKFTFPGEKITIEAESLQDALFRLEHYKNSQ